MAVLMKFGFEIAVGRSNYTVAMSIDPIDLKHLPQFKSVGTKIEGVLFQDTYIVIVRFVITSKNSSVTMNVPYYYAGGLAKGTWFPFTCVSMIETRINDQPTYFESPNPTGHLYKVLDYMNEPFDEKSRRAWKQREIMYGLARYSKRSNLDPDEDVGMYATLKLFGNIIYLAGSYFLLGGDRTQWDPSLYQNGQAANFAACMQNIGKYFTFGAGTKNAIPWEVAARSQDRYLSHLNKDFFIAVKDARHMNSILFANNVAMPHYTNVPVKGNSVDARYYLRTKLLQLLGEVFVYNEPRTVEETERVLYMLFNINYAPLFESREDQVKFTKLLESREKNLRVMGVCERFTGLDLLVKLYRFAGDVPSEDALF